MKVIDNLCRRIMLQQLMNLTSRSFGQPSKRIWILSPEKALRIYAEYTCGHLKDAPNQLLLGRMNAEAYKKGKMLRRLFRLKTQSDIERFATFLYKNIGIELRWDTSENLTFSKCYFSRYYTPSVCAAASALDEGILQGLSGGGKLHFEQRITEGCKCCIAKFTK